MGNAPDIQELPEPPLKKIKPAIDIAENTRDVLYFPKLKTKILKELKFIEEKRKTQKLTKKPDLSSILTMPKLFSELINGIVRLTS